MPGEVCAEEIERGGGGSYIVGTGGGERMLWKLQEAGAGGARPVGCGSGGPGPSFQMLPVSKVGFGEAWCRAWGARVDATRFLRG